MGKYEVTQEQWKSIMGNNPSFFCSCGINCPVENVSCNDIQDFIRKLNDRTGKFNRRPMEAEREYAARNGGRKERYALYNYNSNNKTHPVGQKELNGLGLYDMSGNVWE
jgi:formylglycine-generating enzyme required for sulfatase activity